jgi:hypothetical protein
LQHRYRARKFCLGYLIFAPNTFDISYLNFSDWD